jgi:hypothetical protein
VYLAVVRGVPDRESWVCQLSVGLHRKLRGVMRIDPRQGKPAETRFRVLRAGRETALVVARPVTGRTHQIRLHLAAAGHPIVGDALYGPRTGQPAPETHSATEPWDASVKAFSFSRACSPTLNLKARGHLARFVLQSHLDGLGSPKADEDVRGPSSGSWEAGGPTAGVRTPAWLALRAVRLAYVDPFQGRSVRIQAPCAEFIREHGFTPADLPQALDW